MKIWKSLPCLAVALVIQANPPPAPGLPGQSQDPAASNPPASVPLYRVVVVQGSAKAFNYRDLKSTTKIDLAGTVLCQGASGKVGVESEHGGIEVTAKVKDLPPPSTFGNEFLTYVLWGISPEGRAANLGEFVLKHGKGKLEVMEPLQTFALVVTAEPYFAVSQPSNVVVLENVVGKDTQGHIELVDAKYELLKRGQYTLNLPQDDPAAMDGSTPLGVRQARNAVRIAQAAGAAAYAPEAFGKAQDYLKQAETGDGGKKHQAMMAREAVQRAEDARLISVQKQEVQQAAIQRQWEKDKLDAAKNDAAAASAGQDAAEGRADAAQQENADLRSDNADLRSDKAGLQSKNEDLRARLLVQLNAVLETRATARGLIVNMSGVLFENGKAVLVPAAREKLAKIAGILSTHKGLEIEADGFTDSNGGDAFNQRLSEARAGNTKDYLVSQGVDSGSISSKGFGKGNPIASNATSAGRQENRRVELVVSGAGITSPEVGGL
jgi:outer membrane protein OmpA-like peptidoglycan-associated protein